MKNAPHEKPLTVREAAESIGVDPARVREWIAGGELEAIDVSAPAAERRTYRIPAASWSAFLKARTVRPIPGPRRPRRVEGIPTPH